MAHHGLDCTQMAKDQVADPHVQTCKSADTGVRLEDMQFAVGPMLLCDIYTGKPRPNGLEATSLLTQFTSKLWNVVIESATAYNPQADLMYEHFNRSMKAPYQRPSRTAARLTDLSGSC